MGQVSLIGKTKGYTTGAERAPQFLLLTQPRLGGLRDALATLWVACPDVQALGLYDRGLQKSRLRVLAFFSSCLFHFSILFFLYRIPFLLLLQSGNTANQGYHPRLVTYVLQPLKLSDYFPIVKPPGPGGKPGRGAQPQHSPIKGGTVFAPQVTIVSAPVHADNNRQTVVQPLSPPQLKLPTEVRLPNVIPGRESQLPLPPKKEAVQEAAPVIPKIDVQNVPAAPPEAPHLALSANHPPIEFARLEVPAPPPPPALPPQTTKGSGTLQTITDLGIPITTAVSNGKTLLSLSVDPNPASDSISIPPGNRHGEFSISPVGGNPGSPAGVPDGTAQGGSGQGTMAGDGSIGIGPGNLGGGGGSGSASGTISIASKGNGGGVNGEVLPSFFAATLVYPVLTPVRPRQPALVVSSGPIGGGGLRAYGVLHGGKIYSIYLSMPGKSWILQYCASQGGARRENNQLRGVQVQLEPGLVPPSVEERFDFHRPPFPSDKVHEMIVLHGMIREDGSVGELKVVKGLATIADQAAVAAFGRWKFKPALREGKPVAIEILVGIPAAGAGT